MTDVSLVDCPDPAPDPYGHEVPMRAAEHQLGCPVQRTASKDGFVAGGGPLEKVFVHAFASTTLRERRAIYSVQIVRDDKIRLFEHNARVGSCEDAAFFAVSEWYAERKAARASAQVSS